MSSMKAAAAGGGGVTTAGPSRVGAPSAPTDVPNFGRVNPKSSESGLVRPTWRSTLMAIRYGRCRSARCGYERDI